MDGLLAYLALHLRSIRNRIIRWQGVTFRTTSTRPSGTMRATNADREATLADGRDNNVNVLSSSRRCLLAIRDPAIHLRIEVFYAMIKPSEMLHIVNQGHINYMPQNQHLKCHTYILIGSQPRLFSSQNIQALRVILRITFDVGVGDALGVH